MYGQIDCDYNQFMWILLPEAFFTRQYGNSETIPFVKASLSPEEFTDELAAA